MYLFIEARKVLLVLHLRHLFIFNICRPIPLSKAFVYFFNFYGEESLSNNFTYEGSSIVIEGMSYLMMLLYLDSPMLNVFKEEGR